MFTLLTKRATTHTGAQFSIIVSSVRFVFSSVCVTDDCKKKYAHSCTRTRVSDVGEKINQHQISRLHLNYCTTNHYNQYQAYLPPIGKGSCTLDTLALFLHFFFSFLRTTKSTLHFFSLCMATRKEATTYSLLFILDGIFTFNGCNLTH